MSSRSDKDKRKKSNAFDELIGDAAHKATKVGFETLDKVVSQIPGRIWKFYKRKKGDVSLELSGVRGVSDQLFKETDGVPIGYASGTKRKVYLSLDDWRHKIIQGSAGAGKTTWGANYVIERAKRGLGSAFLDNSDGKAVRWILNGLPEELLHKVILLDHSDIYNPLPIGFYVKSSNLFNEDDIVSAWLAFFINNLGVDGQWMTQELIVNACKAVFSAYEDGTMLEVIRMVSDPSFRERTLKRLNTRWYAETIEWWNRFSSKNQDGQSVAKEAFLRRAGVMTRLRKLKHMVCQKPRMRYEYLKWMDEGNIVLIHCNQKMDHTTISTVMSMHLLNFWLASLSRGDDYDQSRVKKFHLIADEPQTWLPGNQSLLDDLYSKGRRYGLSILSMVQGTAQIENVSRHLLRVMLNNKPDIIGFTTDENTLKIGDFDLNEVKTHSFVARIGDNQPFMCRGLGPVPFIEDRSNIMLEQTEYWGRPWKEVADDIDKRRGLLTDEVYQEGPGDSDVHRAKESGKSDADSEEVLSELQDGGAEDSEPRAIRLPGEEAATQLGRRGNLDRQDVGVDIISFDQGEEGDSKREGRRLE